VAVVAVWLLLSLVAIRVVSVSLCSGVTSDRGWKIGVNEDVITTITIPNDTITKSDSKAVFFLLKITTLYTPCFQDN